MIEPPTPVLLFFTLMLPIESPAAMCPVKSPPLTINATMRPVAAMSAPTPPAVAIVPISCALNLLATIAPPMPALSFATLNVPIAAGVVRSPLKFPPVTDTAPTRPDAVMSATSGPAVVLKVPIAPTLKVAPPVTPSAVKSKVAAGLVRSIAPTLPAVTASALIATSPPSEMSEPSEMFARLILRVPPVSVIPVPIRSDFSATMLPRLPVPPLLVI